METLTQAKDLAAQLLEMTKSLILTGEKENEEMEIEAYSLLMVEREPLVDELSDLRQQLDADELASQEFSQIKKIIYEIAALDKKNFEILERIGKSVKSSFKEIKLGQKIHAGYSALQGEEVSSTINIKQ
ncbi:MAG: hypothetical protein FWD19_05345 [Defluviitaleaceae bacterium]|nr:hypothetical protein [Defluviitaleaceae bacterium]